MNTFAKGEDRMSVQRQDAWTEEEDLILAETVLKYIRQGNTQLAAFKEVGMKLSRTAAACGFRWNSTVRKKYEKAIQLAKQERKQRLLKESSELKKENMTIDDVIEFLKSFSNSSETLIRLKNENERLKTELEKLKNDYEGQLAKLKQENEMLKKDYKAMFEIIERASKVVSFRND